jgi:cytoskeleton-associated protein 5
MRVKFREIMKQICRVYPASKLFGYVIKGIESKNSRTRTECLEEMATLIKRNGMGVCNSPAKMFPLIAAQIADRDAAVRNGAMNVITQAYLIIGDQVYKYVGRLSDKDKSLLEEKFKRLPAAPVAVSVEIRSAPAVVAAAPKKSGLPVLTHEDAMDIDVEEKTAPVEQMIVEQKDEFSLDFDQFDNPKPVSGIPVAHSSSVVSSVEKVGSMSAAPETAMIDFIINQITDTDTDMSINALKHLEKTLSTSSQSLGPYVDDIVSAVTVQIRLSFLAADIGDQNISRLCKHLVNLLVQMFSDAELSASIMREPLFQCVKELLNRLLDPKLARIENGVQLTKALNVLMVRILENCDRNSTFRFVFFSNHQCSTRGVGQCVSHYS